MNKNFLNGTVDEPKKPQNLCNTPLYQTSPTRRLSNIYKTKIN